MIYLVFLSFFLLFALLEVGGLKKQQARWALAGLTTLLILFVGLRYHTGSDWARYIRVYESADNSDAIEWGYYFLNRVFGTVFADYHVLQFVITAFVCLVFYRFVCRRSPYPTVTITLLVIFFFSTILMAQVRQSIALGIVILATRYIFERKLIPFVCVIGIGCMFHISAIAALPLYLLTLNFGKLIPVIVILTAQVFYFFPESLLSIIEWISPFLPGRLSDIAIAYLKSVFAERAGFSTGITYFSQLALALFAIVYLKPADKPMRFFINTLAVAMAIKGVASGVTVLQRLQPYYMVYGLVAYTHLFGIPFTKANWLRPAYVCGLMFVFALPFIRERTANPVVDFAGGRPAQYQWIPYYNSICHPPEATKRKDWEEK